MWVDFPWLMGKLVPIYFSLIHHCSSSSKTDLGQPAKISKWSGTWPKLGFSKSDLRWIFIFKWNIRKYSQEKIEGKKGIGTWKEQSQRRV